LIGDLEAGASRSQRLLEARCAVVIDTVREALDHELLELPPNGLPGPIVVTGAGASVGPARLLTTLLQDGGINARFTPLSSFVSMKPREPRGTLIVLSQGLSPNAGLALQHRAAFEESLLITAADPFLGNAEGLRAARLMRAGVKVWTLPCGLEQGLLVRVLGPLSTMIAAIQLGGALARLSLLDTGEQKAQVITSLVSAPTRALESLATAGAECLLRPIAFVTTDGYDCVCQGLSWKWLEGVLSPAPPIWDVLQVAHGPFQQLYEHPFTLIALEHASSQDELVSRLASMLVPDRHRLIRLRSSLPAPLALLDHDVQLNHLMLETLRQRPRDLMQWPGQGSDTPLYELGADIS
jgi:hypothetical protein